MFANSFVELEKDDDDDDECIYGYGGVNDSDDIVITTRLSHCSTTTLTRSHKDGRHRPGLDCIMKLFSKNFRCYNSCYEKEKFADSVFRILQTE